MLCIFISIFVYSISDKKYTERLNKFFWAIFQNQWYMLLREFAKRRQKETQTLTK